MWKNSLKNVESDNHKVLYEPSLRFLLQRNGTNFLNKPRIITAHRGKICSIINNSSKRSPKTVTFFSTCVAVEENPEMKRIIDMI